MSERLRELLCDDSSKELPRTIAEALLWSRDVRWVFDRVKLSDDAPSELRITGSVTWMGGVISLMEKIVASTECLKDIDGSIVQEMITIAARLHRSNPN